MRVCKPPALFAVSATDKMSFLAGSSDQENADNWQTALAGVDDFDVVVLALRVTGSRRLATVTAGFVGDQLALKATTSETAIVAA